MKTNNKVNVTKETTNKELTFKTFGKGAAKKVTAILRKDMETFNGAKNLVYRAFFGTDSHDIEVRAKIDAFIASEKINTVEVEAAANIILQAKKGTKSATFNALLQAAACYNVRTKKLTENKGYIFERTFSIDILLQAALIVSKREDKSINVLLAEKYKAMLSKKESDMAKCLLLKTECKADRDSEKQSKERERLNALHSFLVNKIARLTAERDNLITQQSEDENKLTKVASKKAA